MFGVSPTNVKSCGWYGTIISSSGTKLFGSGFENVNFGVETKTKKVKILFKNLVQSPDSYSLFWLVLKVKHLVLQKCNRTLLPCSLLFLSDFSPSGLQTCSSYPSFDSQAIRDVDPIQEQSKLQSKEPQRANTLQKADRNTSSPENKGSGGFTCEYCGKFFRFISTLKDHIKTHTLPFRCDKCDKKYASMSSLHLHRMNHTGETPFLCSYCGRGFKTAHSLRAHIPIHTGERRYKCHICGKTSIQHMSRHMRMHRGEKNYLCTECGKAFLSSGELKLHTRSHTGERPYTCKHCEKTFIAKCFLTVHMRRHTGECPYKCTVCPKAFHTLRGKKNHMKIHTDLKSFQCLKCGKIFRQEETFKAHLQTHNWLF